MLLLRLTQQQIIDLAELLHIICILYNYEILGTEKYLLREYATELTLTSKLVQKIQKFRGFKSYSKSEIIKNERHYQIKITEQEFATMKKLLEFGQLDITYSLLADDCYQQVMKQIQTV